MCFLDRTNIGNARLDHLEQDLKLHGLQYNDCLAVLFPFYIAAEIPSNIMMKRTRPSIWLTFIMFFWSLAMILQGFVQNYSGLMATRVFLGMFEGGLFPGVNYYISQWWVITPERWWRRSCPYANLPKVCKRRMRLPHGSLLLRCNARRSLWRRPSPWHRRDVRCWWKGSVGMVRHHLQKDQGSDLLTQLKDIHPRRPPQHPRLNNSILVYIRLPRNVRPHPFPRHHLI